MCPPTAQRVVKPIQETLWRVLLLTHLFIFDDRKNFSGKGAIWIRAKLALEQHAVSILSYIRGYSKRQDFKHHLLHFFFQLLIFVADWIELDDDLLWNLFTLDQISLDKSYHPRQLVVFVVNFFGIRNSRLLFHFDKLIHQLKCPLDSF